MIAKRSFWLAMFMLSVIVSMAQDYHVKGVVTDSVAEPEAFATVRVYTLTDSVKPVSLGTTDENGRFNLGLKVTGDYRLDVRSVGKSPIDHQFKVSQSKPVADLGTLIIREAANELAEVNVVAQRPLVVKEIDRIGYDVQADEDAKTSNVQEILRKVPMVTVENDGTIKVKGSSDFKIYKNGRPNNAFTKNAKDIFAAIPASSIKKIEVITDPGAREDAEGIGAILNIVTLDNMSMKGITGTAGFNVSSQNDYIPSPNVSLTTQIDKVTLSAYGGFSHNSHSQYKGHNEAEYLYHDTGNVMKMNGQSDHRRSSGNFGYWGVEGSWEIDTLNLVTLDMNAWMYGSKYASEDYTGMFAPDGSTIYSFRSRSWSPKSNYTDIDGSVNYQRSTHRKGETITLSYRVSTTHQQNESEVEYFDMVNPLFRYTGINHDSRLNFIEHTGQLDWTHPINDNHKFDVGAKFIQRNNHSKENREYVGTTTDHTDFIHRTSIAAAYFDYRMNLKKWSLRAGVRYEYSRLSAKYKLGDNEDFGSNLSDLVPNLAVSYKLNDSHSLKASYSNRISRPGIGYLNPAVNETPTSTSSGNPDLGSARYNSVSLNYSLINSKLTVDFSANYNFLNNGIAQQQHVVNDHVYRTYENCARQRTVGFYGFLQWSITPKTSFMFNGGLRYQYIEDPGAGISISRWGGNFYTRLSQRLPWKLRIEGYMHFYASTPYSVYSYSKTTSNNLYHGFNLQRAFLKEDRLTLRVGISNPFNSNTSRYTSCTINGGYTGESTSYSYNRRGFYVGLSYRFGSLNAYVKKTSKSISNDDLEGRKNN